MQETHIEEPSVIPKEFQHFSSGKLESMAEDYNWDDGFSVPTAIIRSPRCDLGTALRLYWRGGAQWLTQYSDLAEVQAEDLEAWHFCQEIEARVKNNFYAQADIVFDARADDGSDHTADYPDLPQRRKIPDEMFQPFAAPVTFSMQLLHEAIQSSMELPANRRASSAMAYLKKRVVAGSDMKHIHALVRQHLQQLA